MPSNGEQTLELLKSGCSDAICEGYQRLGLAPNISPKTGERVYSILETKLEYAPKAGEVLKYQLRSDGW